MKQEQIHALRVRFAEKAKREGFEPDGVGYGLSNCDACGHEIQQIYSVGPYHIGNVCIHEVSVLLGWSLEKLDAELKACQKLLKELEIKPEKGRIYTLAELKAEVRRRFEAKERERQLWEQRKYSPCPRCGELTQEFFYSGSGDEGLHRNYVCAECLKRIKAEVQDKYVSVATYIPRAHWKKGVHFKELLYDGGYSYRGGASGAGVVAFYGDGVQQVVVTFSKFNFDVRGVILKSIWDEFCSRMAKGNYKNADFYRDCVKPVVDEDEGSGLLILA